MAAGVAAAPGGAQWMTARRLAAGLGSVGLAMLMTAAVVVLWRRLSGALQGPAEPSLLLAAGAVAATLAGGFRFTPRDTLRSPRWQRLALALGPSLGVVVLGAALSVAGTRWLALAALWGPMVAEELWAAHRAYRGTGRHSPPPAGDRPMPLLGSAFGMIAASLGDAQADGEVTQQLTRSRSADGSETVSGWLRLAFVPGQRLATAHLAFCPPFTQVPELDVRQIEGPSARVKTGQVLPFGARLEVKLAEAAERRVDIRLRFSARSDGGDVENG